MLPIKDILFTSTFSKNVDFLVVIQIPLIDFALELEEWKSLELIVWGHTLSRDIILIIGY